MIQSTAHRHKVALSPLEFAELQGMSPMEAEVVACMTRHGNSANGLSELTNAIHVIQSMIGLYYASEAAASDETIDAA